MTFRRLTTYAEPASVVQITVGRPITTTPATHQLKSLGGADGVSTIKVVKIQTGVARKSASNTTLGRGVLIFPIQYPVTKGQVIRIAHVNAVMIGSRIRLDNASEAVCQQLGASCLAASASASTCASVTS